MDRGGFDDFDLFESCEEYYAGVMESVYVTDFDLNTARAV